jgi:hypothetical protein
MISGGGLAKYGSSGNLKIFAMPYWEQKQTRDEPEQAQHVGLIFHGKTMRAHCALHPTPPNLLTFLSATGSKIWLRKFGARQKR